MNNREKIVSAAIHLIAEKGYDAVSIRKITGEVGIKESSFYNHFSSKKALLDEIFNLLQKGLESSRTSKKEIEAKVKEMTLAEFMKYRLDKFLGSWSDEMAQKLWYVVSHQQYKDKKASALIVRESEKFIEMFETAFETFMVEGKMKKGNPRFLARLYGFSSRAIHLDCTYRRFAGLEHTPGYKEMYLLAENFANQYST